MEGAAVGCCGAASAAGVAVGCGGGSGMSTQPEALPVFPKASQALTVTWYLPMVATEPLPIRPNQVNLVGRAEPA